MKAKRARYAPPVKYTDQQLAYFDLDDLVRDRDATLRQHPEWTDYIADAERKIAAKSASFRAAYGVDPVEFGRSLADQE